jgi:hypothetical protein
MAAFTPRSAKNAQVRINGMTFTAKKWTVTPKVDKIDTTNFESGGYAVSTPGITSIEFTIEADYDAANNPYDLPTNVQPAESANDNTVKLFLNTVSGPYWLISSANFWEAPMTADVKGALGISLKGEGSGAYIYPTGTA